MAERASAQIAWVAGFYRCTGFGETKYCKRGEALPPCTCKGGGTWELLKRDNMLPDDAIVVFVGSDIFQTFETDELPEVGNFYNIRGIDWCGFKTGKNRVTSVEDDFQWGGKSYIRIDVERVGDLADDLPIHLANFPDERLTREERSGRCRII